MRAMVYAGMGRKDEALACLKLACEENYSLLASLKVDPSFDPLRHEPRFNDVLRCARLAP